jgi:predicted methyltransferase
MEFKMIRTFFLCFLTTVLASACQSENSSDTEGSSEAAEAGIPASEPEVIVKVDADYIKDPILFSVNHPERPEADKARDLQRKPEEVMRFFGIRPGMKVLDILTGGGWYAELLSRVVGPEGEVIAQNPPWYYERFGEEVIGIRLFDDRLPNVVRYDHDFDDLGLSPDTFDAVVMGMVFHDLHWLTEDVHAVLLKIKEVMKPEGILLITDHAAPEGSGSDFAASREGQHRIEEAFAIEEMENAGFELLAASDLLRVPEDDRTKPFFSPEMQGKFTDRFVLVFRKPE